MPLTKEEKTEGFYWCRDCNKPIPRDEVDFYDHIHNKSSCYGSVGYSSPEAITYILASAADRLQLLRAAEVYADLSLKHSDIYTKFLHCKCTYCANKEGTKCNILHEWHTMGYALSDAIDKYRKLKETTS